MAKFLESKYSSAICIILLSIITVFEICSQIFNIHGWQWLLLLLPCITYTVICQIWALFHRVDYEDVAREAIIQKRATLYELERITDFNSHSVSTINNISSLLDSGLAIIPDEFFFNYRSKFLCENIYKSLAQLTNCSDMDVLITMKDEGNMIRTVGSVYPVGKEEPSIASRQRKISYDKKAFLDQKYFAKYESGKPMIEVEADSAAVQKAMYKNNNVYGQYILVPIGDSTNLFGLIEIFVYSGAKLKETDEELRELAEHYIIHFVSQALLLYTTEAFMKR